MQCSEHDKALHSIRSTPTNWMEPHHIHCVHAKSLLMRHSTEKFSLFKLHFGAVHRHDFLKCSDCINYSDCVFCLEHEQKCNIELLQFDTLRKPDE